MARIRMAYIGGGSTRGAGTMASFIHQGENFDGSEVVLIDLDPDRLDLIRRLAERMVKARGLDIKIEATTDRRAGLTDCDAILSSYRPGGFAARVLDERIPLKHGVIGQETQGPGGFFMALRAIHAMQGILADVEDVCPTAQDLQLHEPGQRPGPGRDDALRRAVRLALRGPDLLHRPDRAGRRPRRATSSRRSWSASTTPAGASSTSTRAPTRCRSSPRPGSGARTIPSSPACSAGSCASRPRWTRSRPTTSSTTTARTRCSPSCRPSRRRAPRTSSAGRPATGSTTPSRPRATIRSSTRSSRAAASTSSSSRSTPWTRSSTSKDEVLTVNVPNTGGVLPGLRRVARGRAARPLRRARTAGSSRCPCRRRCPSHVRGLVHELGEYQALAADAAW